MYFSEPRTDFRTQLSTDDGKSVGVEFDATRSVWRLTVDHGVSTETLGEMVRYLHDQFYPEDDEYLDNWLTVVGAAKLGKRQTLTLKTVDRL